MIRAIFILLLALPALADWTATLQWDASPSSGVTGYVASAKVLGAANVATVVTNGLTASFGIAGTNVFQFFVVSVSTNGFASDPLQIGTSAPPQDNKPLPPTNPRLTWTRVTITTQTKIDTIK